MPVSKNASTVCEFLNGPAATAEAIVTAIQTGRGAGTVSTTLSASGAVAVTVAQRRINAYGIR